MLTGSTSGLFKCWGSLEGKLRWKKKTNCKVLGSVSLVTVTLLKHFFLTLLISQGYASMMEIRWHFYRALPDVQIRYKNCTLHVQFSFDCIHSLFLFQLYTVRKFTARNQISAFQLSNGRLQGRRNQSSYEVRTEKTRGKEYRLQQGKFQENGLPRGVVHATYLECALRTRWSCRCPCWL